MKLTSETKLYNTSHYNLMGAILTSVSANFHPWTILESCNNKGSCKDVRGFSVDVTDTIARMYNFSWDLHRFPADDWGMLPIQGNWNDSNATFGGVFGNFLRDF